MCNGIKKILLYRFSIEALSTTTPICQISNGMDSATTIPTDEITINDKTVDVDDLRPTSDTPLESSEGTVIIEYTPSKTVPVQEVELVSTENIKTYTVKFYNEDGTVTTKKVGTNSCRKFMLYLLC